MSLHADLHFLLTKIIRRTKSWPHTYNLASLVQESKLDVHKEFTKVCNKFISESKESENEPLAESTPAIKDLVIVSSVLNKRSNLYIAAIL